jgi:hydroxyacyl-ACP dehydratase HTD2-like protein with hotdog domain
MLLETLAFHKPDVRMKSFNYRAINPIVVNRPCTILVAWEGSRQAVLWAEDGEGVVGMVGRVVCE